MVINREKVLSAFDRYTSAYDVSDIKVKLKIDHTYRVAEICEKYVSRDILIRCLISGVMCRIQKKNLK